MMGQLKEALVMMLKDVGHLKELFEVGASQVERLDKENRAKGQVLASQTRQLAYVGKVKNKAIRKYRAVKQRLKSVEDSTISVESELEESKAEMMQMLEIIKKQEQRLEEMKQTMASKDTEINQIQVTL